MRVLLLCHQDLIPNLNVKNLVTAENADWRTEFYVAAALKRLRHEVKVCGVNESLLPLREELQRFKPHIVFNLLEEFAGEGLLESLAVAYLEARGIPFTGCGSIGLILAKNKVAVKRILASAGVLVPGNSTYPKIVKLRDEESSRGISDRSVVSDYSQLRNHVRWLDSEYGKSAFVEDYIDGRELHVSILPSKTGPIVCPVWETVFGKKKGPKIMSERIKWDFAYRKRIKVNLIRAKGLSELTLRKISDVSRASYRALELEGCARVDIRLDRNGSIFVMELNPNPDLAKGDEFSVCARSFGFKYDHMIQLILDHGMMRGRS